jgi:hypothetical protein
MQEANLRDSDMNMDKTRWDSVEANELDEERPEALASPPLRRRLP